MIELSKQEGIYGVNTQPTQTKELFKEIKSIIETEFDDCGSLKILDIGTAYGALPFYLKKELNIKRDIYGLEKHEVLIESGIERYSEFGVKFIEDDAQDFQLNDKFDVIIMNGVITIFNDFRPSLLRIFEHLKDKGLAIVVSMFNDYDIDVRMIFKRKKDDEWQSGYNLFPINDVIDFINENGYKVSIEEHIMPFELKPQQDPVRAWTIEVNNKRYLTNGPDLIYNLKILTIRRKNK